MIGALTLQQLYKDLPKDLNGALTNSSGSFTQVCTDSREIHPGELFVALRGPKFDGHLFLDSALAQGAVGALVDRIDYSCKLPQLQVDDTILGLGQIAHINREKFSGPIVAVTGSSGKTTVRTMIDGILRERGRVLTTAGNLNNHIGVPLTLLRLDGGESSAVIEMGASGIGEIAYLCELADPDVGLVNNVMPAHLEGFGSLEGVAEAKGEIYQGVKPGGTCVVNLDDRFADQWISQIHQRKMLTFSLDNSHADCYARDITLTDQQVSFMLHFDGREIPVSFSGQGRHTVANALAAVACASAIGASDQDIVKGLAGFSPVAGRMAICQGIAGATIIDDAYNANPGSVKAAIDVLADRTGARILVLGDMAELGEESWLLHADVGEYASQRALDAVFTVGNLTQAVSENFTGPARHFESQQALIEHLQSIILDADFTVLVKGSRSAHMDRVVSALTAAEKR